MIGERRLERLERLTRERERMALKGWSLHFTDESLSQTLRLEGPPPRAEGDVRCRAMILILMIMIIIVINFLGLAK